VCLKSGYRKIKVGFKTGYRKRIWVSNMVREERKGLKYGYGKKCGVQNWLREKVSMNIFETLILFL
jgi:hypothetical protein